MKKKKREKKKKKKKKKKRRKMGVHGLSTFLLSQHGVAVESLRKALSESGSARQLLIDGPGFLYHMATPNEPLALRFSSVAARVEQWVGTLRACGAEPIFFFDGINTEKKHGTVLRRRQDDARLATHLYAVSTNKAVAAKPGVVRGRILPLLSKEALLAILFRLGVECRQCAGEADGLIASYVAKHGDRVFGVISNDSDFLILPVRMLPLVKMALHDGNDYRCTVFDNAHTASVLGLADVKLLPIFSCLVGNDYTKEELGRSPQYQDVLIARTGVQAQGSSRSIHVIRCAVAFCNKFLLEASDDQLVATAEAHLLKTCRNREAIVEAMNEALRIIHGVGGDCEAVWATLPTAFRQAYEACRVDNALWSVVYARAFWSRIACSGEFELNPLTRPLRMRLYGLLLGGGGAGVTEYFQQGNHFVYEKVASLASGRDDLACFAELWGNGLSSDERFEMCAERVVLPMDDVTTIVKGIAMLSKEHSACHFESSVFDGTKPSR